MKTDITHNRVFKHIICCLILLIIFVITITKVDAKNDNNLLGTDEPSDAVPLRPQLKYGLLELKRLNIFEYNTKLYDTPRIIEKNIEYYIEQNEKTLLFFSKAFGYDIDYVKNDLIKRAETIEKIEPTNIGSIKNTNKELKTFRNIEYGIVEYFYELSKSCPEKRNRKVVPYTGSSSYIEKLIMYYTQIYSNVDTSTALSIGAAESGYYKVKFMLRKNNIYGGMTSKGLIKYENIEIGVLKYIKLLSKNYFSKGLTTINSIGKIYCPTISNDGNKVASPHWIKLVNTAKQKYDSYKYNITIEELIN